MPFRMPRIARLGGRISADALRWRSVFPVRDLNPTQRRPYVTWVLIAINLAVWLFAWSLGPRATEALVYVMGAVPQRLTVALPRAWPTLLTSMFMHASWAHVLGNAWFLHVFGDNVEDHLGHFRYAALYLLAGLAALATHVALAPGGTIPVVGASGAIAGALGAYMVRFPRAPILAWFVIGLVELPAWVFLFVWFGYQLVMTVFSLGSPESGGVAFAAHAGGFVAGALLDRAIGPSREAMRALELEYARARAKRRQPGG
jgi:membrane associated rhomboid family serine protease